MGNSNGSADWITTDPALTNLQPSSDATVEVDPSDPTQLVVTFEAGFAPCAGGRAIAVESDDAITVTLEIGIHSNVAAMTCPAGTDTHELVLPLQAEVGSRTLSIDQTA